MTAAKRVLIGELTAPHGVRGLLRLRSFAAEPAAIFSFINLQNAQGVAVKITQRGASKDGFIVAVDGVADRNAADGVRGTKLYIPRDDLPAAAEREFYVTDLEGLEARTAEGKTVGTVARIIDYGVGPVLEIKRNAQAPLLLLFNDAFVLNENIDEGYITIIEPNEI